VNESIPLYNFSVKTTIAILMLSLLISCGGSESPTPAAAPAQPAAPTKAPDENAALDGITKVNEAQSFFFKRNRRYALTLDELVESRDLKTEPTAAETGYGFTLRPAADAQTYRMTVTPSSSSATARHFFTDQTGTIHAEQGKDATAASPPVTK
jgi:hypothetical protein